MISTKSINVFFLFIVCLFLSSCEKRSGEVYSTEAGAIAGYDPVAYFKEGKPVKGKPQYSTEWNDAKWHFSTQDNLDAFASDPVKYAPQYGGYCAYGTAEGHKAPTESDAWTIVNNKLYLNYNKDVKSEWTKDQSKFIHQADSNWTFVKSME